MSHPSAWEQTFTDLFHASVTKYQQGHQKPSSLFDAAGEAFLASIGYTEQELFDFVEDFARGGEPTLAMALAIASVRRDYFLEVQKGVPSPHRISVSDLPAKDAQVDGIGWLPRLLPKAEAKLRGEMPSELMFGCGGDRKFFRTHGVDPAEFLRRVWQAKGRHTDVIAWIKAQA